MADPIAIDRLQLGDHVCWTVADDDQHLDATAQSVKAALREGQRVVYLTDAMLPVAVLAGLAARGIAVEASLDSGQLQVRAAEETYLAGGRFDPASCLDAMAGDIERAEDDGWAGLRLVGDMGWALRPLPGVEHLAWYEAQVNRLFAGGRAMGLCLYDRRLFSPGELHRATSAHPASVMVNAGERWMPLLRIRRVADPPGLRLVGEADLSNRHALATVLGALIDDPPDRAGPLVVDVSELAFADGAAASLLVRAGRANLTGMRIVGCSAPMARLLEMVGAKEVPGLTVTGRGEGA